MSFAGNAAIVLAFLVALYAIASALLDSRNNKYGFPAGARWGVYAVAGLMTAAVLVLLVSFLTHNYSLKYVYDYSANDTPFVYLLTGLWAGNAGSLMFWGWIIAVSGALLLWRSDKSNRDLMTNALAVILFTEILFMILLFIESPFAGVGLSSVPLDGLGLRPVLQTPLMIFHPPVLLAGYAIITVPFALAISALLNRRVDEAWLLTARRWAIAAWLLLGLGNVLGMWWAYAELGWGGYWAWDPVENAGLMPWLILTALLHSSMLYLRRSMFKGVTTAFALIAFLLTVFGAFLTRSNIAGSVHTFGGTAATPVFIIFLLIFLAGSLWLFFSRSYELCSAPGDDSLVSATGTFGAVNLLLSISTAVVFIGTVLPFFTQAAPAKGFFNISNLPIFGAVILLAGACLLVGWRKPDARKLNRQLLWPAAAGAVVLIVLVIFKVSRWYALIPFIILAMTLVATLIKWGADVAARMSGKHENALAAFGRLFVANRARYGGYLVHAAIVVLALGITGSSAYRSEVEQTLNVGDSVTLSGYTLKYNGFDSSMEQKSGGIIWLTVVSNMDVSRGGRSLGTIHPTQTIQYVMSGQTITEAPSMVSNEVSILSSPEQDYYVILEDFDGTTHQGVVRILVNPLVWWIWWVGFPLFLLGGLVSFSATPRKPTEEEGGQPALKPSGKPLRK
jgi:cytochrome c-type biogenesis protein CcmF